MKMSSIKAFCSFIVTLAFIFGISGTYFVGTSKPAMAQETKKEDPKGGGLSDEEYPEEEYEVTYPDEKQWEDQQGGMENEDSYSDDKEESEDSYSDDEKEKQ